MKLEKTTTEAHNLMKLGYGNKCLSCAHIFEGFEHFKDGQDVEDNSHLGCPFSSKMDDNIQKVGNLVPSDHSFSIRAIVETVGIDKESLQQILQNNFNIQRVCAKMVPKILTFEQEEVGKNVGTDTSNATENDPNLLERIIIRHES